LKNAILAFFNLAKCGARLADSTISSSIFGIASMSMAQCVDFFKGC